MEVIEGVIVLIMLTVGLYKHIQSKRRKSIIIKLNNDIDRLEGSMVNLKRRLKIFKNEKSTLHKKLVRELEYIDLIRERKDQLRKDKSRLRETMMLMQINYCSASRNNFEVDQDNPIIKP